jgi:STE24 endopeptidase
MGLAGPLRRSWWIPGGAVFVGLAGLFAFLLPYLIPSQVEAPRAVVAEARTLAEKEGLPEIPVRVQEVRTFTTAPNAEAAGLGPSRRVILWDTLLDGRFGPDEVRVVLAHELGHLARDHVWKLIGWYALFAFPGAFLIARATRRRSGMADPAAVPLSLFVLVVLQIVALPAQNVITRHVEAEADWVALQTTQDAQGARTLFRRFSTTALADPSPPTWAFLLMETHPTIAQRIAMADAWEARQR